jgi:membrane protein implicated in regulation of membrane protease activity
MTRALVTDRIVGVAGAIAAGIGLWRFTSGAWIQGIVFALAVASLVAYTLLRDRRRGRDTRRY